MSIYAQSETILRDYIAQQGQAWNNGDARTWSSFFTVDARFVTLRGDVFESRAAIEKSHTMIFSTFYKGSHNTPTVESITFPTGDVAVIDVLHEVRDYATLPPGIAPTEPGVLRARMKYVAVRQGSDWRFASAQNTAVFPKLSIPAHK